MPGYEDRASILQGVGDMIFQLVLERSTPEQWAEWLRAPLEHAAGTANHNLVRKLLKAGADGRAGWEGCHGKTLLHAAAEGGSGQVVSALITAGAGADMKSKAPTRGHTPLHLAIFGGKEAAAKMLITAGADANIVDAFGDAPLHLAIEGGHVGIARDLLISGADSNAQGSKRSHPLHLAASRGQNEVVLALVHRGADLNCRDSNGRTPLVVAVQKDRVSTVEVLLAAGADANFEMGLIHETVLHRAALRTKTACIPALFEGGVDIDARDGVGYTPLSFAAWTGSCAAVLALLRLGGNVNTKNDRGRTPLHLACYDGEADAADLLLRWGADETIVDGDGDTPGQRVPDIDDVADEGRPSIERLTKLLAHAPQDRAWRRRGFVVMCRAHPDRLRLVVEILDTADEVIGEQPQQRPSRRARRGRVKVEVGVDGALGGGVSSSVRARRRVGGEGVGGGFDGVAAWLMAVPDEEVFRKIVGFL